MPNRQTLDSKPPLRESDTHPVLPPDADRHLDPNVIVPPSSEGGEPLAHPFDSIEESLRSRLEDACHRLESGGAGPARLDQLAEYLGVSARQANRCFHAVGLASPMKEIRRRRLREALDQIQSSSRTLEEIAAEFNYYDGSSLSRALKRAFGFSPMVLRHGRVRNNGRT